MRFRRNQLATLNSAMHQNFRENALHHWNALAKPPGSLATLGQLAGDIAQAQRKSTPTAQTPAVLLFAGAHGIAESNPVSAYPTSVNRMMLEELSKGRAAVSILASKAGATLDVYNVGVGMNAPQQSQVDTVRMHHALIQNGTASFDRAPAMTTDALHDAIAVGRSAVQQLVRRGVDIIAIGELGIGNTASAAAIAAALLGVPASEVVGPGTGLSAEGVQVKATIVDHALRFHGFTSDAVLCAEDILARVGGLEIGAMVGAILETHQHDVAMLLDGFTTGVAALAARAIERASTNSLIAGTLSAEPGHAMVLDALNLSPPLLQWGMRLGEASGATLALPICRAACALFTTMARLDEVVG